MIQLADTSIVSMPLSQLLERYPLAESLLLELGIEIEFNVHVPIKDILYMCSSRNNIPIDTLVTNLISRINELGSLVSRSVSLHSLDIISGSDKSGNPEPVDTLSLHPGDLLAIVGSTGSGKSRLLADIEWVATGDTPSKRVVLINNQRLEEKPFLSGGERLIAQLSQTMSFVLDSTVEELLTLHAGSRGITATVIHETLTAANDLSGEPFKASTALTSLSGGQTRALMVADTALICKSPIVLIDEIENAGIDRKKAFDLLLSNEKIVLLATHDPMLALFAPRRLCMKNGAMSSLHIRSEREKQLLSDLEIMDSKIAHIRSQLRNGSELSIADKY
jgi:ABC-type lipoprotein export system ATPase subunit